MPTETLDIIDVLLVEDDSGDVLLTREAFADYKIRNRLHVVTTGTEGNALPAPGG